MYIVALLLAGTIIAILGIVAVCIFLYVAFPVFFVIALVFTIIYAVFYIIFKIIDICRKVVDKFK